MTSSKKTFEDEIINVCRITREPYLIAKARLELGQKRLGDFFGNN